MSDFFVGGTAVHDGMFFGIGVVFDEAESEEAPAEIILGYASLEEASQASP